MLLSKKKVRLLNDQLAGHMVKIYETDEYCCPIRTERYFICGGEIVRLQPTSAAIRNQQGRKIDVKTRYGYLCLISVKYAAVQHQDKIGNEYIFNVADEDIEAILAEK